VVVPESLARDLVHFFQIGKYPDVECLLSIAAIESFNEHVLIRVARPGAA